MPKEPDFSVDALLKQDLTSLVLNRTFVRHPDISKRTSRNGGKYHMVESCPTEDQIGGFTYINRHITAYREPVRVEITMKFIFTEDDDK